MRTQQKQKLAQLRHWRIRKKVVGTRERPRMSVRFTNQNIYVQFVDDSRGVTLASASTTSKALGSEKGHEANVKGAQRVGKAAAETAVSKGIKQIVFDRSGARFHGKVKALADAAREAGLQF